MRATAAYRGGMPPADAPFVPDASWMELRDHLVKVISGLANGDVVRVDLPDLARPTAPRGGRLGRLLGTAHVMVAPWVRLRRQDDHLRGEALRGVAGRGPGARERFPMSREEADGIVGQGWHETRMEESGNFVRWWPDDVAGAAFLPEAEVHAAAEAVLRLLHETYGATPEQVRID